MATYWTLNIEVILYRRQNIKNLINKSWFILSLNLYVNIRSMHPINRMSLNVKFTHWFSFACVSLLLSPFESHLSLLLISDFNGFGVRLCQIVHSTFQSLLPRICLPKLDLCHVASTGSKILKILRLKNQCILLPLNWNK